MRDHESCYYDTTFTHLNSTGTEDFEPQFRDKFEFMGFGEGRYLKSKMFIYKNLPFTFVLSTFAPPLHDPHRF